ncbi:S-layer homology domain-containing protein [Peptoniphilus lacrimalis]|uniref:S-layer homology domain-containing protein n=1 Tax=Peptoniphilus lacrimalis TaxID=33031 RepID=UPI0023F8202C|nr:S-layer homology domain-containing protein [Peptoniphilus lacrimalis]
MKKLIVIFLSMFLIFIGVYANEDIQVVLEQPAVSSAKSGENLLYNLNIKLPKDYKKKYESFSVSVLMDGNLKVLSTDLVGAEVNPGKINLKTTENSKTSQNIISLNVDDISKIDKENLNLKINTKVRKEIKSGENLENSFVLSYQDRKGYTGSSQKNLESSTKAGNILLKIDDIYANSKTIKGKSEKNATIVLYKGKDELKRVKADKDGNFSIDVNPFSEGEKIRLYAYYEDDNVYVDYIVKGVDESYKTKDVKKSSEEVINSISNMKKISDYVAFAKGLPTAKATKEEEARLKAAIAGGEYLQVKKVVKDEDIGKVFNELQEAIKGVRKPYMVGSEGKFNPDKAMTRAEVCQVLSKIIMGNKTVSDFSSFKDVDQEKWYAGAVTAIESRKLISGYSDGTFKPEKEIKRSEFAMIIYNYLKLDESSESVKFSDVSNNHWAKKAIDTLVANKIMVGTDSKYFNPDGKLKRCQAAVIVNNILDRKVNKEFLNTYSKNPYKDLSDKHWAYYQILEVSGL